MRALLIDMDGTLVETETRWWQAEIDVMQKHGSTWDIDDQNLAIGGPLSAVVDYMADKSKTEAENIYQELVDSMYKSFTEVAPELQPGWSDILNQAKKSDLQIALVTASNRLLAEALLKSSNLEKHFDVVVASDDLPRTKPHPDPYLHAAKLLGVEVLDCLVFEDSNTGVTSSLAAKMPTIALPGRVLLDERRGMKILQTLKGMNLQDLEKIHKELVKEWQDH
ncbi:MAG: HAD family phosphatase [Actinobacteria bacterium]|nr:HAD family phosphatase [Actinomycetota bacterium]